MIMLVAESRMVMGKAHVFHVGSLSHYYVRTTALTVAERRPASNACEIHTPVTDLDTPHG